MGEMMFAQCHDQWMGVLGKKRPQIMSVDGRQFQTWKKQKITSLGGVNEEPEVGTVSSVEMRRAMLKARFADAIFKATLKLQGGSSSDVSTLQQQIRPPLVLEKHHTHKARTRSEAQIKAASQYDLKKQKVRSEAQIKAAEAASQRKDQYLKKRREAERKAARMMEKSVYVDEDAASIMRDFEKLIGGTGLGYPNTKKPQKRLDVYMEQAEDDVEEGEIVS